MLEDVDVGLERMAIDIFGRLLLLIERNREKRREVEEDVLEVLVDVIDVLLLHHAVIEALEGSGVTIDIDVLVMLGHDGVDLLVLIEGEVIAEWAAVFD